MPAWSICLFVITVRTVWNIACKNCMQGCRYKGILIWDLLETYAALMHQAKASGLIVNDCGFKIWRCAQSILAAKGLRSSDMRGWVEEDSSAHVACTAQMRITKTWLGLKTLLDNIIRDGCNCLCLHILQSEPSPGLHNLPLCHWCWLCKFTTTISINIFCTQRNSKVSSARQYLSLKSLS